MIYTDSEIQDAFAAFTDLINIPDPAKAGKKAYRERSTPQPKNAYRVRGLEAQQPKVKQQNAFIASQENDRKAHHERHIQAALVTHPFLLHTPELYAGGLYLDSIIDQLPLSFPRKTDFVFVTTQQRTVKITLVEIEQAAKQVFRKDALGGSYFDPDTVAAINQVKGWQRSLRSISRRKCLLTNLSDLFVNYPIELFDETEEPLPHTRLEFSYMLVVGNEVPDAAEQALIDRLYIDHDILFMTYPMMLAISGQAPQHKNVLSLKAEGLEAKTLDQPVSLGFEPKTPAMSPFDPYGIRMAGLDAPWISDPDVIHNAAEFRKAIYRSGGVCEKPGCDVSLDSGDLHPVRIYNQHGELDLVETWDHTYNNVLTCSSHAGDFNDGKPYMYGHPHPLNAAMRRKGAYRHDLDVIIHEHMTIRASGILDDFLEALGIDPSADPELANEVTDVAFALARLFGKERLALKSIAADHFKAYYVHITRSVQNLERNPIWGRLLRAKLLKINTKAPVDQQVEPAFFSLRLINHVEQRFKDRFCFAFYDLFSLSVYDLKRQLKRIGEAPFRPRPISA